MTKQQAVRAAQAALDYHIDRISIRVQRIAEQVLGRPVVMRQTKVNGIRLVAFKQWEQELNVPLRYILGVLLPHWRDAGHIGRRPTYEHKGLGVSVSTLTGKYSRKLVEAAILQDYPNGEHFDIVRERIELYALTRCRQYAVRTASEIDSEDYVKEYRSRLKKQRQALENIESILSRRAWRGNPFRG